MVKEKKIVSEKFIEDSGYLFWQTSMLWERSVKKVLDNYEVTLTQFYVMAAVNELPKGSIQNEISVYLNIDRMMTSRIVTHLRERGIFIVRSKDRSPASFKKVVTFTPAGEKLFNIVYKEYKVTVNEFFDNLELPTFRELLPDVFSKILRDVILDV
ncbi:MarR family winged helix-turn-helix transcriptional regulator [Leptospira kmetyi]|uniref:MarR family transcriptional regulator n=1 Tax=Leptospira kmetyi TaxID=408139 RepID=A0ABX4N6U2_9LEPT|nr:MarR family winged helix-turn-helix transcriptional regulator [Leptospira kmetyi]PJZ28313.1 hypothetical protein CH378_18495 [Leptospira kmetyi]